MKLCRFKNAVGAICPGLIVEETTVLDLSAEVESLIILFDSNDLSDRLASLLKRNLPRHALGSVQLVSPIERQEVWAVGVTYLRSKKARMQESDLARPLTTKFMTRPDRNCSLNHCPKKLPVRARQSAYARMQPGACRSRNWPSSSTPVV